MPLSLGLNIIYTSYFGWGGVSSVLFILRYDTYHDIDEAIFDMYQRYILSGFGPKNLIYPQISQEFGNFND